jgi:acyl dehydratase
MSAPEATMVHSFTQDEFDRFARLSGDDNPIHTDPEFSARTHFGRTVAHGLLLCSLLRGVVDQLVPGARMLSQSVMFPAPTFTDEPMRFHVAITRQEGSARELELSVTRVSNGEVSCQGNCRVIS